MSSSAFVRWGQQLSWCCAVASVSAAAEAQPIWVNTQAKADVGDGRGGLPTAVRYGNELRFDDAGVGLVYLLARAGAEWSQNEHVRLVVSGVGAIEEGDARAFRPEARFELEPHFRLKVGAITFDDRNRLERRWFADERAWRYRNRLEISVEPEGSEWNPVVSGEIFWDVDAGRISESRTKAGLFWQPSGSDVSFGLSHMIRARNQDARWAIEPIAVLDVAWSPRTRR